MGAGTQVGGNPLAVRTLFAQSRQSAFRIGRQHTVRRSQLPTALNWMFAWPFDLDAPQACGLGLDAWHKTCSVIRCGPSGRTPWPLTARGKFSAGPVQVVRAIPPMMPNESPLPEPKPSSIRLSCPVCHGMLVPLAGNPAVKALERHLERDHWYSWQVAHDAAMDQFALQKAVLG